MKIILSDLNQEIIQAWQAIGKDKRNVDTFNGSIFEVQCDAIVSPANSFGFMDGSLDLAISQFFGWHVQEKLQEIIKTKHHGELLVGNAEIVETNHPTIPYLISAPTMRVPMILKDSVNVYLAIRAILLLVKFGKIGNGANISDLVRTVAIPGMGTGVGRIPPMVFAKQMKKAVEDILEEVFVFPKTWQEAQNRHRKLYANGQSMY